MKQALISAVMAALAVVALAGWTRPVNSIQPVNAAPAYNQLTPVSYNPPPYRNQRVVSPGPYVPARTYNAVRRGRPLSHSVAIVAGSAGAGAAIGAIAGHGKGAAIGALAGGLGGFIYDRLTHNK